MIEIQTLYSVIEFNYVRLTLNINIISLMEQNYKFCLCNQKFQNTHVQHSTICTT